MVAEAATAAAAAAAAAMEVDSAGIMDPGQSQPSSPVQDPGAKPSAASMAPLRERWGWLVTACGVAAKRSNGNLSGYVRTGVTNMCLVQLAASGVELLLASFLDGGGRPCRSSHSRQPSAAAVAATTPWLQLRHPPSTHVGPNPPSWMQAAWAFAIAWAPPAPRHCGPAAPSGLWTAAHAPGAEPLARYAAPVLGQIQRINTLVLTLKSYVSKDSRLSPYMQSALNSE
eukprot:COSAG06_NODE_15784_length_1044_cov_741.567196_2_plen_228_part_00